MDQYVRFRHKENSIIIQVYILFGGIFTNFVKIDHMKMLLILNLISVTEKGQLPPRGYFYIPLISTNHPFPLKKYTNLFIHGLLDKTCQLLSSRL